MRYYYYVSPFVPEKRFSWECARRVGMGTGGRRLEGREGFLLFLSISGPVMRQIEVQVKAAPGPPVSQL